MLFSENILLIDDDPMSNMINEKIIQLTIPSVSIKSFVDANQALTHLKQLIKYGIHRFPDAIFLDINMPVMDGWEFLEEVNKFSELVLKGCNIFMLTSSIDQEDIEKSRSYKKMCDFISKPLTGKILETILSSEYRTVHNSI